MPLYLSQFNNQPKFQWDLSKLSCLLGKVRYRQGRLLGRMELLGSSAKEILLERQRILPEKQGGLPEREKDPGHLLTEERLLKWHGGSWRNPHHGSAHIVHRSSPDIPVLRAEIRKFLNWFNREEGVDPVLKAGISHLWLLVIRPFDEGSERIAHLVTDIELGRAEGCARRYYDLPAQMNLDGAKVEEWVGKARQGMLEITDWLEWFLGCLDRALGQAELGIVEEMKKARFTDRFSAAPLSDRQQKIVNKLLGDGEAAAGNPGRISSSQWASIAGCSQDTALRDIQDLIDRSILIKEPAGGRSTQYMLREPAI